jgi:tripartite-type tricarboxylate transporter receptor subunit TctC
MLGHYQNFRVRMLVLFSIGGLLFVLQPVVGMGSDYPTRPITITVGFPPGGSAGVSAHIFAEGARKYLPKPQSIFVNYKPGAASAVAADYVLKQSPDGYNLAWNASDLMLKLALDGDRIPFRIEDFIPIGTIGITPAVLAVRKESSFKQLEDFLRYAKENPGKLSCGSTGIAGTTHLAGEVFQIRCGVKLNHVPFTGAGPGVPALLGGHIDSAPFTAGSLGSHIQTGGGLRGLAVFAHDRLHDLPDIPTALEKGYDIDRGSWYYLAAQKGTPQAVIDILLAVFKKTAEDPQVKEALTRAGFIPLSLSPGETEKKAKEEFELAKDIFKKIGLLQQ